MTKGEPTVESTVAQRHLYFTAFQLYDSCPRAYLWGNGYGNLDLGRGPGRSKLKPNKDTDSKHHAVMGIVLARAIEHLYNDELWREPETLVARLTDLVNREFTFALNENFIDWGEAPPKQEMLKVCVTGALGYLKTMKSNKLLGPYAKSEVDLTAWVDQYTPIGGRPDVIIRREDNGVTIIDGKNAMTPGKYTDPDQLRWYALCFYLAYNVVPSRLAFAYFRYPEGTPPRITPKARRGRGLWTYPSPGKTCKPWVCGRKKPTGRSIRNCSTRRRLPRLVSSATTARSAMPLTRLPRGSPGPSRWPPLRGRWSTLLRILTASSNLVLAPPFRA